MQFKFLKDPKISGAGIEVYIGNKWKVAKELKIAEKRLREKEIRVVIATSRTGQVFSPTIRVDNAAGKEKHQLLQGEIS